MTTTLRALAAAAAIAALAGCSLNPPYERPAAAPDVTAYAATPESGLPVGEPGADHQWWRAFGSPELDALVDEALTASPDLASAAARVLEARATLDGQNWNRLPSVEVGGTWTRSQRNLAGMGIPRTILSTMWDVSAQAAWELDLWGRLSSTRRAAWTDLMAREADRRAVRQGLVADVVRVWLEVRQLEEQRDLGARTLATYRDSERMVTDRYEAGVRPSLDVHQARQNVASAEAAQAAREQELAEARRRLELLLGRYPAGAVDVGGASLAALPALPPVPVGVPSDLMERRPDVIAAEMALLGAHAREGAARADLFPRLTLSGSKGWSTPEQGDLFTDGASVWSLVGGLAMPLLNRGARKAQVGVAEARREQAASAYVGTVLRAFRDVESALDADRRQHDRREALRAAAVHARRALEVADERYVQGLDTYLQLLDAQRRLLQTESDLLRTEQAWRAARVNLIQSLGGSWDETENGEDHR